MFHRDVSPRRAWNTWDAEHPARLAFLPAGAVLTPMLFSTRAGTTSPLPMTAVRRLGQHDTTGDSVALELHHGGSDLRLSYRKAGFFRVDGQIRALNLAEWGWKFWLLLGLGFPESEGTVRSAEGGTALIGEFRSHVVALRARPAAVTATVGDDPALPARDLETYGSFYSSPTQDRGRHGTLRLSFSGPVIRFSVAVGTSEEAAMHEAEQGLLGEEFGEAWPSDVATPGKADALAAVRDVIGWNTIFDTQNKRYHTALSRNWQRKFGGWGVWLSDMLYHAYLASFVDLEIAERNLTVALNGLTPDGNLPCLLTEYTEQVDRTQSAISAGMAWRILRRSGSKTLLEAAYPVLLSAYRWWDAHRDGNHNGLLELGTSGTGTGRYVGTPLAAISEMGMENSPMYDDVTLDPVAHTLRQEDVGINSLLVHEAECLADMARSLGRDQDAEELAQAARRRATLVQTQLWDRERQIFANRFWDGSYSSHHTPTSFYPLAAGAATDEQAATLVRLHLLNENRFWGPVVMPSVARDDPAFRDNVYWRGRVWGPLNFWTYQGLRRYGYAREAHELAKRSLDLFWGEWREGRRCYENFNATTGAGGDQPDSDWFYSWTALLPLLTVLEEDEAPMPRPTP